MALVPDNENRNVKKEDITDYSSLTANEQNLIYYIRKLQWGNLEVLVQKGCPVMIKQMVKTIKLIDHRIEGGGYENR